MMKKLIAIACVVGFLAVTGFMFDTNVRYGIVTSTGGINLTTSTGTLSAGMANDTAGGINVTSNGGKTWEFANSGSLASPAGAAVQFNGATSGAITVNAPSVAGSNNQVLQAAADTFVYRSTTDLLSNKSFPGAGVTFNGSTSGTTTLKAAAIAGATTITFPASTGNVVVDAATQTLSAKTLASPAFTGTETGMSITSPSISSPTITGSSTLATGTFSGFATFAGAVGCTTAASVGAPCQTTTAVSWSNTFPDTSYFAQCQFDGATTGVPVVTGVLKVTASTFKINIAALTAVAATGNVTCTAFHS
jgi:hypothetical protein